MLILLSDRFPQVTGAALNAVAAFKAAGGSFAGAAAGAKVFATSLGVLKTALGGIAIVGTLVYSGVQMWKQHQEELRQAAEESAQAFTEQSSSIEDYVSQIQDLKGKLDSGSLTEQEAYSAKKQLFEIQTQLNDTYGDSASGIDLVNGKLDEQIEKTRELIALDATRLLNEQAGEIEKANKAMTGILGGDGGVFTKPGSFLGTFYDLGGEESEALKKILSKYSNIELDSMGESGEVRIRFVGDAEQAKSVLNNLMTDLRHAQDKFGNTSIFGDIFNNTSSVYNQASQIISDWKELYEAAQQAKLIEESSQGIMYADGDVSQTALEWINDYAEAVENYNNALIDGDTSKINEARTAFDGVNQSIQNLLANNPGFAYFASMFEEVGNALNGAAVSSEHFKERVGNQSYFTDTLKNSGMTETQFADAFISGLGLGKTDRAVRELLRSYAVAYGVNFNELTVGQVEAVASYLTEMGILIRDTTSETVETSLADVKKTISDIGNIHKMVASQGIGKSLTAEDYSSEGMKEYADALEYVNGAYQLNAEKVNELVQAKAEIQLSNIAESKQLKQMEYIKNAREISKLTRELKDGTAAKNNSVDATTANIKALRDENDKIKNQCTQYDLMSASIREAAGAYQNWLDAQSGTDYGDMADQAVNAIKRINDTFKAGSQIYGDFGSKKYSAAVDFIVPTDVSSEGQDAIKSYMTNFRKYVTANGKELNTNTFIDNSVKKGLMEFNKDTGEYFIATGAKVKDFAEQLNLSSGVVQAFFDQLKLKGWDLDFSDETIQTFDDLAVKAYDAAEALRDIEGNENLKVKIDVSDLDTTEEQVAALDKTIEEMQGVRAKVDVDATEAQNALDVIQFCIAQKQVLTAPDIMRVDTSGLNADLQSALDLLKSFQDAKNYVEIAATVSDDAAADAQAKVDGIVSQIQANSANLVKLGFDIDTSSEATISSAIQSLTADAMVTLGVDATAITGYNPESKTCEVIYDPKTELLPKSFEPVKRDVIYRANTGGLPNSFSTITRYVRYVKTGDVGTGSLNGTAHAGGTAKAKGDWGTARGGRTLVGELGKELVVDVHTGHWFTVGDNGAEFRDIPQGAIVFNHLQTESLLRNGYTLGRAQALASGTAMVSGGGYRPPISGGGSGISGGKGSGSSSSSKDRDNEPKIFDWIEIAIDRIERIIESFSKKAESAFKSLATRIKATNDEIDMVTREIALQQSAYYRYISAAEDVGLSSDLKQRVRDGAIDIAKYDDDTRKLIDEYRELYEKALDCKDSIEDLHETLSELYKSKFDNVQNDFNNQIELMEKTAEASQKKIDKLEALGYMQNATYYREMQNVERNKVSTLNSELHSLQRAFDEAMASGTIEEGSDAWYEMLLGIEDTKLAISDAEIAVIEFDNAIRDIEWDYFDYAQERISQITSEADFLMSLLDGKDMYDSNGNLSDNGVATIGLGAEKYGVYMAQADKYAEEIKRINKELANDPNNKNLIARRDELLESQRESILAAKSEKEAMIDLVRGGIEVELEAVKKLIDVYNESLDSAKDLHDYQKKIAEKTANISTLEKQLAAYQNDMSEEARAKVQKIQVELKKSKDDLKETEYDRFISEQKKALDSLYSEYEEILNARFDNIDETFAKLIDMVNENFIDINEYLSKEAGDVGYSITEATQSIWANGGYANGIVSEYGSDISTKLTAVGMTVENIFGVLEGIARENGVSFGGMKAYASGGLVDYTGLAKVHGSKEKPELMLDASDTKNFLMLRDALRSLSGGSTFGSVRSGDPIGKSAVRGVRLPDGAPVAGGYTVGDINISIPIEHIDDYNDFVNQLKNDRQFEQMIQSITVGRLAGKSKLDKNKYRW